MVHVQLNDPTDLEIRFDEVAVFAFLAVLLPFEELAAPHARVLIGFLVDLDGVVSAEEIDDELAVVVVFCLGNEAGFESQDVLVLSEHLDNVLLRRLGLESVHAAQTVFQRTVTVVRWHVVNNLSAAELIDFDGSLGNAVNVLEELFREIIAVVDKTLSAEDIDRASNNEVLRSIELFLLKTHAWVVGVYGHLRQLLPSQQKRKRVPPGVLATLLLNFNTVICEEVIDGEEVHPSFKGAVLPERIKREHFPVVVEIFGESAVRMSPS